MMATTLHSYLSTTAQLSQNSPLNPTASSEMICPPDSTIRATEDGGLTAESSVPLNSSKVPEESGHNPEALPAMVPPEEQTKPSENADALVVPFGTSHVRVRQEYVSVETLRTYHIDHYIDIDPECIVITRSVPDYEMDFLRKHTVELHKNSADQLHTSDGPLSTTPLGNSSTSPVQLPPSQGPYLDAPLQPTFEPVTAISSEHLEMEPPPPPMAEMRASASAIMSKKDLLLQTNRVRFDKWLEGTEENKRGECVLDVAMQPTAIPETQPSINASRPSDAGSSDTRMNLELPVRLAINSLHVRTQLEKITACDIDYSNKVMHPPWKLIVTYHEDIRKRLHDLEKIAEEEYGENLAKGNEQLEQAPIEREIESMEAEWRVEAHTQEGGGWPSQVCEVCENFGHNEKFECLIDTISHLKCFVDFMDNYLKHVFELRRGLKDATIREIAFEDLWHLFSPGDLLITSGPLRERQALKVFYTSGGRPTVRENFNFEKYTTTTPFTIECYYIDFDKKWLGPVHQTITIPHYEGKRPIKELTMSYSVDDVIPRTASTFPIRFLEQPEIAIAALVKRGKRHRELTPFSHKRYCGPSSVEDPEYLNSEIIIDFEKEEDNDEIGKFDEIRVNENEVVEGCTLHEPCYRCRDLFDDNVIDKDLAIRYKQDLHLLSKRDAGDQNLTDDHLMLLPAVVNAFVLRERDTFGVYVDLVKDLDGDNGESLESLKKQSGFEDLVLPEGHGDIVEALVRMHRSTRKRRDEESKVQVDLIDGKGEGLVILLHGVPGVGKTSTAECVAAYTRRPLYPITCANIGLDPEEVEKNLTGPSGHFRRAQQWNCVVLLDEADVFLAKRETRDNDAKRNALVSVFLRTLEYYPGILILTTNRVGSFDEAVVSRIQLFLYYPPLDKEKTMKVWRVHINRVRSSGLTNIDYEDEAMIMEFAEEEYADGRRWNGRQIRNFFQTAISLASYDATKWRQRSIDDGQVDKNSMPARPRLTTRTLKIVAATSGKFEDYIKDTVLDGSYQKQQLDEGNRNDGWQETPKKKK